MARERIAELVGAIAFRCFDVHRGALYDWAPWNRIVVARSSLCSHVCQRPRSALCSRT
jgi:hypothetical protein